MLGSQLCLWSCKPCSGPQGPGPSSTHLPVPKLLLAPLWPWGASSFCSLSLCLMQEAGHRPRQVRSGQIPGPQIFRNDAGHTRERLATCFIAQPKSCSFCSQGHRRQEVEYPPAPASILLPGLLPGRIQDSGTSLRSQENAALGPHTRAAAPSSHWSPFLPSNPPTEEMGGRWAGGGSQQTWPQPGLCHQTVTSYHSRVTRHGSFFLYNPHSTLHSRRLQRSGREVETGAGGVSEGGPNLSSEQQADPGPRNLGEMHEMLPLVQK